MLRSVLDLIEQEAKAYPKIVADPEYDQVEVHFVLPKGATERHLAGVEQETRLLLPAPFRELLCRWNGPYLFQLRAVGGRPDMPIGGLHFDGTAVLCSDHVRELAPGRDALVIATGRGHEILMEPGRDEVYVHEEGAYGGYALLVDSLDEFLQVLFDRKGQPFWRDRALWKAV